MQTHLLLRENPRALALRPTVLEEAPSGVLVFEGYEGSNSRAIAKLYGPSEFEDHQWRILNSRPVFGCLGLITVRNGKVKAYASECVYTYTPNDDRMLCCHCHRLRLCRKN